MAQKPNASRPFRHPLLMIAVRNRVSKALHDQGVSEEGIKTAVAQLSDDVVEETATHFGVSLGDGGLIASIIEFIKSPQFLQLVAFLVSLFVAPAPAPPP